MSAKCTSQPVIYLDNAATTFPKPEVVYEAQDCTARTCCANPGRGGHRLAHEAAQIVLKARLAIAGLFSISDCARIVFTSNATEAINIALFGFLQAGDRVVTTTMEHNAVTRPLYALQQRGIEVVKVVTDREGHVKLTDIQHACQLPTKLVVLSHCSNVSGSVQPIEDIGPWCRSQGITFMVDAAQSAGVLPIDVETMAIDLLAVPGHKSLLGPQGTGFLYVGKDIELVPLKYGGTGSYSSQLEQPKQMPDHLESGTLNTPALAAFTAAIQFVQQQGLDKILHHEQSLLERLRCGLGAIAGVKIYGPKVSEGGVLSFTVDGIDPATIGFILDQQYNIAVRVGLHCAPDAHRSIGSFPQGTVRVSPGYFNTVADIDNFLSAMRQIVVDQNSLLS